MVTQLRASAHPNPDSEPTPLVCLPTSPSVGMKPNTISPTIDRCAACGRIEPPSDITDNMARFGNTDARTDGCLRRVGIKVPVGTEVRLCRTHAVMLERELAIEYGTATPYVRPLPATSQTVGVATRPQVAELTTWLGDPFLPPATLGPEYRLFGRHRARRVSVQFGGKEYAGIWLPDCQDLVRLRAS